MITAEQLDAASKVFAWHFAVPTNYCDFGDPDRTERAGNVWDIVEFAMDRRGMDSDRAERFAVKIAGIIDACPDKRIDWGFAIVRWL